MKYQQLVLAILAALAIPAAMAQSQPEADLAPQDADRQAVATEPGVLFHLAGYADATYIDTQGDAGSAGAFTLAPIFHLQVGERFLFESELELAGDDRGGTETAVEYAAINWLINDNAALVAGKFLSPVGYFFQNMHPSWINKMASVPVGFGHGGAAPLSDFGLQLRGGKAFASGQQLNYALYNGNGPQLGLEIEEGGMGDGEFAVDLNAEGSIRNRDGKRVTGGRIGWLPIASLEVGASLARGDVVLDAGPLSQGPEPSRRYQVDGIDAAWHPAKALELRGEWIRQRIGAAAGSLMAEGATWRAWYLQGAYRFGGEKWEAVLRHGDSVSPHAEATLTQTAIGLNYLFDSRTQLKATWESNDSADAATAANRLLLQFAYGF